MGKNKNLPLPLLALTVASLILNVLFVFQKIGRIGQIGKIGQIGENLRGTGIRVIDGDTFDIEDGVRIRLAGAEAPEYPKGCLSLQAKERLEELVLGKKVEIEPVKKDNFGRQLGFVKVGGLLVDRAMVEEGLAQAAGGENPKYGADLLAAQDSAKKAKRGIWSSLCAAGEECLIKGSYRRDKGTKIYHLPECYNYEKIVINEREGDRWFCTEEEAKAAGFRKSEDCPRR